MTRSDRSITPRFLDEDDRKTVVLDRVRLEFRWESDRWTHALIVGEGGESIPLARAIEGGLTSDPNRVISPAYQQLHWQDAAEGAGSAMVVGMSGPHHFSAVFALGMSTDGNVSLDVDVADRCRAPVDFFAATYLVDRTSGELIEADDTRISWGVPEGQLHLEAGPRTSLSIDAAGRRAARVQALGEINLSNPTQRCVYRWRWVPESTTR